MLTSKSKLIKKKSILMALLAGVALCIFAAPGASASVPNRPKWTDLARKVGTSEDVRAQAIKDLKSIKGLNNQLRKAIYTSERPLALDVISALDLKELIPDLLLHVPADPDGFLTVAVNSMMNEKNQTEILKSYTESLEPKNIAKVSPGAIVAMLEPLGRLSVKLSRPVLTALKDHTSPEVRSSTLYYLRMMSLRNRVGENLDLVSELVRAKEFQIRLQAVSVSAEILSQNKAVSGLLSKEELKEICAEEKAAQVRDACLGFLVSAEKK